MKKVKKIITGFLMVFIFMALVLPMTTVKASEEKEVAGKRMYTVTFRAGNVASFDTDKITVSDGMEVTKNYIKVKVAKGDTLAFTVPGWESDARLTSWFSNCLHYEKEAAYGLKAFSGVVGTAVERNTEYVLDYKRLIDPVSYTVSFIDSQTKEQIAAPQIIYGNAEETIMVTPVTVSDYTPTESSKIIKLEKGKENTATFEYRYTGAVETITSTVTNVVPGTTRTETVVSEVEETVIVPGTSQPTGFTANVVNNASNAVNAPVGNTANNVADNNANNAADNAVNAPADDNEDQTVDDSNVEIPEEQTPLVDGDENDGVVDIEESETPLSNTAEDESTVSGDVDGNDADLAAQEIDAASVPVAVPVIGGIAAVFIGGLIAFLVYKNRKRSK
ncbi:hypothetical protein [Roseburia inulinivorans]|jgi:hypothetical protein|uniref:MucBP domain-containing protein n=1 Tax=Roseburia inulinivorans TaxID=360807 RepID=A0A3R6D973_9FIRM|nr:hypothetical protein [Roseburia inulinivorans]RHF86179.1 hypothetical protein DW654_04405 [Roseburia inulinivorans]